jgi:hypothetical protein
LIAFVGGKQARALGRLSLAERQEIVVKEVAARFSQVVPQMPQLSQHIVYPPTDRPYVDHDWAAEEWTRGDPGYMEGAVRSGERAAADVLAQG